MKQLQYQASEAIATTAHSIAKEIHGWEAALSAAVGILLMLPILMDLFQPAQIPFGIMYILPACLYAIASTSHERIWSLFAVTTVMLVAESGLFLNLHGGDVSGVVLAVQGMAFAAVTCIVFFTHYRLWSKERDKLNTDLNNTRQELNRAREILSIAEDSVCFGGYEMRLDSGQSWASEYICDVLGKPPECGFNLDELIELHLPVYKEQFADAVRACYEDGTPFSIESQILTQRNERLWLAITGYPEYSGEQLVGIIGSIRELTAEKEREKALTLELNRVNDTIGNLPGVLWQINRDGQFRLVNNSEQQTKPEAPDLEAIKLTPMECVHPGDRFALLRAWLRARRSDAASVQLNARLLCQDQTYRHFCIEATRCVYENGLLPLTQGQWLGTVNEIVARHDMNGKEGLDALAVPAQLFHKLNNFLTSVMGSAEAIEHSLDRSPEVAEEAGHIVETVSELSVWLRESDLANADSGHVPDLHSGTKAPAGPKVNVEEKLGTILLVDDDELIRRHTRSTLSKAGYKVICAADGIEALSVLQEKNHCIDALITDMFMPGAVLGSQLVERSQKLYPHIKTILTSGYDTSVVNFFNPPGQTSLDILAKPFMREELLEKVETALTNEMALTRQAIQ